MGGGGRCANDPPDPPTHPSLSTRKQYAKHSHITDACGIQTRRHLASKIFTLLWRRSLSQTHLGLNYDMV